MIYAIVVRLLALDASWDWTEPGGNLSSLIGSPNATLGSQAFLFQRLCTPYAFSTRRPWTNHLPQRPSIHTTPSRDLSISPSGSFKLPIPHTLHLYRVEYNSSGPMARLRAVVQPPKVFIDLLHPASKQPW